MPDVAVGAVRDHVMPPVALDPDHAGEELVRSHRPDHEKDGDDEDGIADQIDYGGEPRRPAVAPGVEARQDYNGGKGRFEEGVEYLVPPLHARPGLEPLLCQVDLVGEEGELKNGDQKDNRAEGPPLPVVYSTRREEDEAEGQENGEDGEQRDLEVTYLAVIDFWLFQHLN